MPVVAYPQSDAEIAQSALGARPVTMGPSLIEQTHGQVSIWGTTIREQNLGFITSQLTPLLRDVNSQSMLHYRKVREQRKHPTIKLVRNVSIATMAGAEWSLVVNDEAPDTAKEFISDNILPLQHQLMSSGLRGLFDYGWAPYEKVFNFDLETFKIGLAKLKPLLQDQTEIIIYSKTGAFAGFKQFQTYLTGANCLLLNQDVEGTYHYGESSMMAMQIPYDRWLVTDASNTRYDHKISGAHWVIHYPVGTSKWRGKEVMDNYDLANRFLQTLEGSGGIVVPDTVRQAVTDLNNVEGDTLWKIELITADAGQQAGFQQRLAYLDALMVRAGEFPERSILEGQYGTKAEAGEHADFAVARMDWRNANIEDQINRHLINQLLVINYGQKARNSVKLKIAPIADDKITFLKTVYQSTLTNPMTSGNEFATMDMQAIRDQLEIPTIERSDDNNANANPMLKNMLGNLDDGDSGPDDNANTPGVNPNGPVIGQQTKGT